MLIDTHAHVNFNAYKDDADKVIRRSLDDNVWMINVGSQYDTSKRAVEFAEKYQEGVYAAIGLHPIHLVSGIFKVKMDEEETAFNTKEEEFDSTRYKELALRLGSGQAKSKVVAIGEIGLDYYYKPKTKIKTETFKNLQKEILLKELDLAKELDLPIIFHCRMAHEELIEILKGKKGIKGVIHCFTGNWEQARKYMDMGLYLGLNGIIFKLNLDEVIEKTPLEKIVVETDCPYLTPPPMAGRNEPMYVEYIVEKIAQLKNLSHKEISDITTKNAKELFKI
ncbi:MAG: TatD family hydrolase [Patescibacteria group bacterium]